MKITEAEARQFAGDDFPDFNVVDEVIDHENGYKDYAPATTISERTSDGTFWALDWNMYTSHYGSGEHMYNSLELRQVKQIEKVKITKEWVTFD